MALVASNKACSSSCCRSKGWNRSWMILPWKIIYVVSLDDGDLDDRSVMISIAWNGLLFFRAAGLDELLLVALVRTGCVVLLLLLSVGIDGLLLLSYDLDDVVLRLLLYVLDVSYCSSYGSNGCFDLSYGLLLSIDRITASIELLLLLLLLSISVATAVATAVAVDR